MAELLTEMPIGMTVSQHPSKFLPLMDGNIYRIRRGDPEWPEILPLRIFRSRLCSYAKFRHRKSMVRQEVTEAGVSRDIVIVQFLPRK